MFSDDNLKAYVADAIKPSNIFCMVITKIKYAAVHAQVSFEWTVIYSF